jgi:ankyrin repeat protein
VFVSTTHSLQSGRTPLVLACSRGHVEVVTVLLSAGASTEVQNQVRSDEGSTRVVLISFVFNSDWKEDSPSLCLCSRCCGSGL